MIARLARRELFLTLAFAAAAGCGRTQPADRGTAEKQDPGSATVTLVVDGMV